MARGGGAAAADAHDALGAAAEVELQLDGRLDLAQQGAGDGGGVVLVEGQREFL